jgi:pSer/pThr/pTyr-binding forkhead associated (FHA) protein
MRLTVYFPEDSPTTHEFVETKLTIGRLGDNDVKLDEESVSSHHAEIIASNGGALLRDLNSTNGTFHNGEQVTGEVRIAEGDEIHFGNVRSVFMEPVASAPKEMEAVMSQPAVEITSGGGCPENFRYLSPFPREKIAKDSLAGVAWGSAAVAVMAAVYALMMIFGS